MQSGNASVDVFGVFDGHGGKQAAVYASKHMMGAVLTALNERISQNQEREQDDTQNGMSIPAKRDVHHEGEATPLSIPGALNLVHLGVFPSASMSLL